MQRFWCLGLSVVYWAVVAVILLSRSTSASEPFVTSPHAKFQPVGLKDVRWTTGFWAERFELCHKVALPKMKEALLDPDNAASLINFRIGAGLEQGKHVGTNWSDGDCYKWLEALARVYAVTGDPALDQEMDHWIDLIRRTQEPDGYICTQIQLDPTKSRWERRHHHELYNMGHLMTAAAVHYQATGKKNFLEVAEKLANYLYGVFAPAPRSWGISGGTHRTLWVWWTYTALPESIVTSNWLASLWTCVDQYRILGGLSRTPNYGIPTRAIKHRIVFPSARKAMPSDML